MIIYTDGSCSYNPGPGSYGALEVRNNKAKLLFLRTYKHTTNNEMELRAVLMCLINFYNSHKTIYCDSRYVVDGFNNWMYNWNKKNWKVKIKHIGIWKLMYFFKDNTVLKWVKAHSDNGYNDLIDRAVQKISKETWN